MNFIILPLQMQELKLPETTAMHSIIFFAAVGIITSIIIYLNVSKKVRNSKAFTTGKVGNFESKTPEDTFYKKLAYRYSLKKNETAYLKELLSSARGEPEETLQNSAATDELFKSAYQRLAREADSSSDALCELQTLFALRRAIYFFNDNGKNAANGKAPRSSPRRECNINCACYTVELAKVKENGKTVKKLKLSGASFQGRLLDVSSGGCAINAPSLAKTGAQMKIEFNIGKRQIAALGQVIRINKDVNGTIFHIQFLKVQPKTQAALNAFVFSYV